MYIRVGKNTLKTMKAHHGIVSVLESSLSNKPATAPIDPTIMARSHNLLTSAHSGGNK
jgi:hypothetical protein